MVDRLSTPCLVPGCLGVYTETSIYDDWDGILHCSECKSPIGRHSTLLISVAKVFCIKGRGTVATSARFSESSVGTKGREVAITTDDRVIRGKAYPESFTPNTYSVSALCFPELTKEDIKIGSIVWVEE